MFGRNNVAAYVAEFLGTAVLTLVVFSVQRSTIGVPFFVAMAAGLAIVIMSFALGRTSGGYFNPAIAIAFWTARKLSTVKTIGYIAAQFAGAYAAYALYKYMTKSDLQDVGGEFAGRIMVAEVIGTAVFAFGFAAAVYQRFTGATSAAFIGLSLTLGIITASAASIAVLNPAVAFGIRAWEPGVYVLGPIVGAVIAVNLYALLFAPKEVVVAETATTKTVVKPAKPASVKKTTTAKKVATKKKTVAKKKK